MKTTARYEEAVRRNLDNALRYNRTRSFSRRPRVYSKHILGIREDDARFDKDIDEINSYYTQYLLGNQPQIKLKGES